MRITFILPPLTPSGGIRVVAIYAERLRRKGHRVVVVTPLAPRPSLRRRLRALLRGKREHQEPRVTFFDGLDVDLRRLAHPPPVTESDVPDGDVVIATWFQTAPEVMALSRSKGKKVYFLQGYEAAIPFVPAHEVDATWRLPMQKIVVAEWLADLARERFGDSTAVCVPNSVDAKEFFAPPRSKQQRPTVGFIYSPAPLKGSDIAIDAIEAIRHKLPGLRAFTFSTKPPTSQLPVPSFVEFILNPPQSRIRELYAECDVFLQASRTDGFGLPILEAMACRTPVIATPAGAAPTILRQGGGKLIPHDDASAMAAAIVEIVTLSDVAWMSMSEEAYRVALSYSWDDAAAAFEAALESAVKGRKSSQPVAASLEK